MEDLTMYEGLQSKNRSKTNRKDCFRFIERKALIGRTRNAPSLFEVVFNNFSNLPNIQGFFCGFESEHSIFTCKPAVFFI